MKKRPLGTIESNLLTSLASREKNIFTIAEARKITKGSYAATRLLLSSLVEKRWLIRLVPGKYLIVPLSAGERAGFSENWFVIGRHLIEPAPYYFSHYSALSIHEMASHPVNRVYISTPKRRKSIKAMGAVYQFVYKKPESIWGIEEVWANPTQKVKVSNIERTIIDCLANPKLCGGISEAGKGIWVKRNGINHSKIISYCRKLNNRAVIKRLGFMLDLFDIAPQEIEAELQAMLTKTFVLLDPSLKQEGRYTSKWRLRINLNPEELKAVIRT